MTAEKKELQTEETFLPVFGTMKAMTGDRTFEYVKFVAARIIWFPYGLRREGLIVREEK